MGNRGAVELLISRGAMVHGDNRFKMSPLHIAASQGHGEICMLLLKAGPRDEMLRLRDRFARRTAAQWAKQRNHKELAALLRP